MKTRNGDWLGVVLAYAAILSVIALGAAVIGTWIGMGESLASVAESLERMSKQ